MEEKMIRTKRWQRVGILAIAIILLVSTMAMYLMIVVAGTASNDSESATAELQSKLEEKQQALEAVANTWSDQYFEEFSGYKTEVKAYNAETANAGGVETRDLKEGDGATLAEGDTNYLAYYIGFCPNETIFDSSLDSAESPTKLKAPIAGEGLIEGWNEGVVGMKLGGVREITMPGELAYKDQEMCDMTYAPLKFIVMALAKEGEMSEAYDAYVDARAELLAAYGY